MKIIRISQNADSIELQGGNLIVYHRTKDQGIAGDICTIGFIAGSGEAYGRGIYTTYNLESSLQNYNLTSYGGEVVKAQVNINGFLIFDYDVAQMVYGTNYSLTDQIRNVIGEKKIINNSLDRQKQLERIEKISKDLNSAQWTSDYASIMSRRYRLDESGVNGIIFTGRHDGKVCLVFKELLITPVAHAWIDGKTYKNPTWTDCGQRSYDELKKLQQDESKAEQFRQSRRSLLDDLKKYSNSGTINIDPSNYPTIPSGVFEAALANFLYEDERRIDRLSPTLRTKLKDIIDVEFMIRKLKSAPTVYWNQWQKLDPEVKKKIPEELLIDIWEKFIVANPGYWSYIPDDIRPSISKEEEAKYWFKLVKKNPDNWKHVHPEIIEYIEDNLKMSPPADLAQQKADMSDERVAETEEIDIPISALGWVQDMLSKLNKRAGRLGLRPITHEVISEDPKNRTQKIKIVGNVPYMKGWKLLARVSRVTDENDNEYNAVETLSDEGIPDGMDLENAEMRCDDCGHNRKRKDCYIVKNESATKPHGVKQVVYPIGATLMIGSTCLRDFIGDTGSKTNPDGIAKYAQEFRQMLTLFKEGSEYQNKTDDDIRRDFIKKGVPIVFFLTKVMQLDNQYGFTSRNDAYRSGKEATANLAWQMCVDLDTDKKYSQGVSAADLTTIYSALNWISSVPEAEAGNKNSEFLYNLKKSCEIGTVFNKKRNGNIGLISWLPTAYKKNMEEKIDYKKISGEEKEEIFFAGNIISKRPVLVQVSQQVVQGKNITQNYIIAQSEDGRSVAWLEDSPIKADIGQPIYLKGTVENNVFISGVSSSILKDVKEISKEDYEGVKPLVDKRLKELSDKEDQNIADLVIPAKSAIDGSPQGNYQDGAKIVEQYTIDGKKRYGAQTLYFLADNYGEKVSTFTNMDLGEKGDEITLSATVKFNKGYTNLIDIQVITDSSSSPAVATQPLAPSQPIKYQDGMDVEDDFTITDARAANYGSTLYNFIDSSGQKVSAFIKGVIGNIGDTVRIRANVKIKGQYINLQRVKIIPRQAQAPVQPVQPTQQTTAPITQTQQPSSNLPSQPVGTANGGAHAKTFNWYKLSKMAGLLDKFNPANWVDSFKNPMKQPEQQPENESEVNDLTQDPQNTQQPQPPAPTPSHKKPEEVDLNRAYDMFADSYNRATGKAWDKSKFLNRADNWIFFGDEHGYIAVRPQKSGLYKLVGVAGDESNPVQKGKSLIKGFKDIMAEGKPTWGMVSQDLKSMAERMGMKSPTPMFLSQFMKYIPAEIFGGAKIKNVLPDGGVEFEYKDIGSATKYLIANDAYFQWLKDSVDGNSKIPKPAKFILKKMLDRMAKSRTFIKIATVESFIQVENSIDLSEI
ncbi:MAG: hypothetical protein WC119_01425 [Synergistaceae bacterium]